MSKRYQHLIDALSKVDMHSCIKINFEHYTLGYVDQDRFDLLCSYNGVFKPETNGVDVCFTNEFVRQSVDDRTEQLTELSQSLRESYLIANWRNEPFSIYMDEERHQELFQIERGVVPFLGLKAHGVHLNGYVLMYGEPHIWVARRSKDRAIAPLKLDQIVAGGLPASLSVRENLIKEGAEEASIPMEMMQQVINAGTIQYMTADETGIRNDILHCFDLEMSDDFIPTNRDGEVENFMLLPIDEVLVLLEKRDEFKPNTAWVMLAFLLRHGWVPFKDDFTELKKQLNLLS